MIRARTLKSWAGAAALVAALACVGVALASVGVAFADDAPDFYRGKQVTVYLGYEAGGAYDLYGRVIAKHLGKHIPGAPGVLAVNMPGASSMTLGNYLARLAPRDGTAFGIVNSALLFDPLFAGAASKAQFKGPDLTAVGNALTAPAVLFSSKSTGVKTLDDIRGKGLMIGAMTKTGDTYVLPSALKKLLDLDKLKIVTGYAGTREVVLALERGEVFGRVWDMEGIRATRPQWLEKDGDINIVVAFAPKRTDDIPAGVPLARDFVSDPGDRAALDAISLTTLIARPFIAPPGLPPERTAILRKAFRETMEDPDYLADMKQARANAQFMSGEDMERYLRDAYALPAPVVDRIRGILNE